MQPITANELRICNGALLSKSSALALTLTHAGHMVLLDVRLVPRSQGLSASLLLVRAPPDQLVGLRLHQQVKSGQSPIDSMVRSRHPQSPTLQSNLHVLYHYPYIAPRPH